MKKIFTLFVMMMIGFATSWAQDVASIIQTNGIEAKYSSFSDAWSSVKSGETIKLLADRSFAGTFQMTTKSITIDLNGYKIYSTSDFKQQYLFAATGSGKLVIKNGTLEMNVTGKATNPVASLTENVDKYNNYACIGVGKNATIEAENVTFDGGQYAIYTVGTFKSTKCIIKNAASDQIEVEAGSTWTSEADQIFNQNVTAVYISNTCTVSMTDTQVTASGNGSTVLISSSNVTLQGCTLKAQFGRAIYAYNSAKVKIINCNLYNKSASNATLHITGNAEVTLAKHTSGYTRIQNDDTGVAVLNQNKLIGEDIAYTHSPTFKSKGIGLLNSGTATLTNITIEATGDGVQATAGSVTINANNVLSSVVSDAKALNAAGGNITIEDTGRYKGALGESGDGLLLLKGGYYSASPSSYRDLLCSVRTLTSTDSYYSDGYRYEVVFSPTAYNVTKDKYYTTLTEALGEAVENNEVRLMQDITLSGCYNLNKQGITVDLNNHLIKKTSNASANDCTIKITANKVTLKNGIVNFGNQTNVSSSRVIAVYSNNVNLDNLTLEGANNGIWVESGVTNAALTQCKFSKISDYLLFIDENATATARYCQFDVAAGCMRLVCVSHGSEYKSYVGNTYKFTSNYSIDVHSDATYYEFNGNFSGEGRMVNTWTGSKTHLRECKFDAKSHSDYAIIDSWGDLLLEGCTITDNGEGTTILLGYDGAEMTIQANNNKATQITTKSTAVSSKGNVIIKDDATITSQDFAIIAKGGTTYVESANVIGKLGDDGGKLEIAGGYYSFNPVSYVVDGCTSKAIASGSPMYTAGYRYQVTGTPVTSIDALDKAPEAVNAPVYNIQGARLAAPARGLNIVGGKKVMVK